MPIYVYKCDSCGKVTEQLQKFSDPRLTVCPSCGAEALRKQVTAAGFELKGTGWYVTDFRGEGGAPKGDKETNVPSHSADGKSSAKDSGGAAQPAASKPAAESKPAGTSSTTPAAS